MVYDISLTILLKTFGKEFTQSEVCEKISDALWKVEEFRDVLILEFKLNKDEI